MHKTINTYIKKLRRQQIILQQLWVNAIWTRQTIFPTYTKWHVIKLLWPTINDYKQVCLCVLVDWGLVVYYYWQFLHAFLASAVGTRDFQDQILHPGLLSPYSDLDRCRQLWHYHYGQIKSFTSLAQQQTRDKPIVERELS